MWKLRALAVQLLLQIVDVLFGLLFAQIDVIDGVRPRLPNCEHRSYQVDELIARYSRAWHGLIALFSRTLFLPRDSAEVH